MQRRRNLELEGFTTDISTLRRTVSQFESQWAVLSESLAMLNNTGSSTSFSSPSPNKSGSSSRARALADEDAAAAAGLLKWRVKSSGYGAPAGGVSFNTSTTSGGSGARRRVVGKSADRTTRRKPGSKVVDWPPAQHTRHAADRSTSDDEPRRYDSDDGVGVRPGSHAPPPPPPQHHKSSAHYTSSFGLQDTSGQYSSMTDKLKAELDRAVDEMTSLRNKVAKAMHTEVV